jgi:hypothetical protein
MNVPLLLVDLAQPSRSVSTSPLPAITEEREAEAPR